MSVYADSIKVLKEKHPKLLRITIMAKSAKKAPGLAGQGNFEQYQAMMGLRSSNAAQPYDSRPARERTRSTSKRKAIRDGW